MGWPPWPPPAGGRWHCCILLLTSIEKCELFFCLFYHGDPIDLYLIFCIIYMCQRSHIWLRKGKEGKEEQTEEAFHSLAWMNIEDSLVATGQKPSGFNLKGERADLFLGHKMSNRIQRKAGFLTLGTGQNKKPLAFSPSLIPKNFIFLLLFKLVLLPLWSTWRWTTLSPENRANVEVSHSCPRPGQVFWLVSWS